MGIDYTVCVILGVKLRKSDILEKYERKSCKHYDEFKDMGYKHCPVCGMKLFTEVSEISEWLYNVMWNYKVEGIDAAVDVIVNEYNEDVYIGTIFSSINPVTIDREEIDVDQSDFFKHKLMEVLQSFFDAHNISRSLLRYEDIKLFHVTRVS